MLEDEPIYTGLECPQCGAHLETPPSAHGEILCPECRAIVMFATSGDDRLVLSSRHTIPVPSDMLEPRESTATGASENSSESPPSADAEGDEFRVSAPIAPSPQTWFLPPPMPPVEEEKAEEPVESEAAAPVREPLIKTFVSGVVTYAWRPVAIRQWMLLAAFAFLTLEVGLTIVTEFSLDPGARWGAGFFYIFPGMALLVYTLAYAGAYLAAVIERTAYNVGESGEWPDGDWRQRFLDGLRVGFLLMQAAMFGGMVAGLASIGAPRAFWPVCVGCVFFLFPIIFLSALETNTLTLPVSLPVWRSLRVCWSAWVAFYVVSALLWLGWAAVTATLSRTDLIWPLIVGPLWGAVVLDYGRLMGRLAGYLMRHAGFLSTDHETE